MDTLKSLYEDIKKVFPLLLLGALLILASVHVAKFFGLPENASSLKNMGGALVALGFTHVARRILLPKITMQTWIVKAQENPLAIAICFAAMVYLISQLFNAFAALFVQ